MSANCSLKTPDWMLCSSAAVQKPLPEAWRLMTFKCVPLDLPPIAFCPWLICSCKISFFFSYSCASCQKDAWLVLCLFWRVPLLRFGWKLLLLCTIPGTLKIINAEIRKASYHLSSDTELKTASCLLNPFASIISRNLSVM